MSTRVIGLIVPSITNAAIPPSSAAPRIKASALGYSLFLTNVDRHWDRVDAQALAMVDRGVEGVGFVFTAPSVEAPPVIAVEQAGARVALLLPADDVVPPNVIALDNEAGMRQVVDHLWSLGHRHFGFATNARVTVLGPSELAGLRDAVEARGGILLLTTSSRIRCASVLTTGTRSSPAGAPASPCCRGRTDRPRSAPSTTCWQSASCLRRGIFGIAVPAELSIVGYAALNLTRVTSPAITSVRHPFYRMGELLASILIEGHDGEGTRIIPTLEVRESTATAPGAML